MVCCVSDQFEQDEKCRDMFLYIKEQLFKKFAIAVIRESLQWKHSELGMKIGQPVSFENWIYLYIMREHVAIGCNFFSLPISRKREGGPTNLTLIDINDFIIVIQSESSLLF